MGRTAVRRAIQQYLTSANVQFLGKVYQHPPKFTQEGDFVEGTFIGEATGAVIFIHLTEQSEERVRLIGLAGGGKQRKYTVGLVCVFRSKKANTEEVGADNDTFLDSLVEAIEANRTAASPDSVNYGAIFQWGEGDTVGGIDITVKAEMPRPLRMQASQVFSVVEVTAIEMNAGAAGE